MGTNQSPAYPIGTDLGNKGQTPAALRAPAWRLPSQAKPAKCQKRIAPRAP